MSGVDGKFLFYQVYEGLSTLFFLVFLAASLWYGCTFSIGPPRSPARYFFLQINGLKISFDEFRRLRRESAAEKVRLEQRWRTKNYSD